MKKITILAAALCLACMQTVIAQTGFYDLNTIQRIEISFTQPDWDYQMDTAKSGSESYIMAQWVKINGVEYDSVGVKYKGNSSYNATYEKNPVHISLDEFKNQSYQGFKDVKLGNGYADPSMIREVLSYDILQNYMDCPRANFAELFINGVYIGLYSNVESINKKFCSDRFSSSQNTLVKCNPMVTPGPTTKSNLRALPSVDSTGYFNYYEMKSDYGWNELVKLCDTVTNYPANIESAMDMDRAIWMLAFNNVLVNLDSYTGVFCQNYYLYKDNTARFNPIIWDLNMSLGGFPYVGSGASSMGSLTVTNMQQLSPTIHSTDSYWPLIKDVMNNPMYKRMYIAHMRTIANEMFVSSSYQSTATQLQSLIDTAVVADTNMFFTYAQFQTAMTTNNVVGSYTVPGISNLMSARITYLQSTTEFSYTPPTITAVTPGSTTPALDSALSVTANVTNANAVYLGYRFEAGGKFTRILMYDDGAHNDGAAGDNVYGTSFTMSGAQVQYYIYAENADAGMFSPQRAEHEFYSLLADAMNPTAGQVVINEFLAQNVDNNMDEEGKYEDWIELYNNTSTPLNLFGLYMTDNYSNPTKFAFPSHTIIPANGYLVIFADEDSTTASYLHCNFKLSASGEQIMISNGSGNVIDSITFGAQSGNISMGRCPNGTGGFVSLTTPSFNTSNCTVGIEESSKVIGLNVYPNPATDAITVELDTDKKENTVKIMNILGKTVLSETLVNTTQQLDVSGLSSGVYILSVNDNQFRKIQIAR